MAAEASRSPARREKTPPSLQPHHHQALAADPIDDILKRSRPELLALPRVVGTGHGRTPEGDDAITVWVTDPEAAERVSTGIEGYPVIVNTVPGGFRAYEVSSRARRSPEWSLD
jgi:hypothetical protein